MAIESVGQSIISKIAELLVEPAIRQFRYMFCFNNFVQEFNEQKQSLALAQDRLQNAVNGAERNAEEIEKDVKKWLEDANKEIEDMKPLEDKIGKNGKCFTWGPNWMRQFKLSKVLAEKTETARKLNSKNFPTVSHKAPLQPIEFLPSRDFTTSESSNEAFKQIMEALKDDNVNMIGLYGMGGVGKTTLMKEVGRRAKELQLFDQVLMAVVSQNPSVTNIQNQMADMLGLKFDETAVNVRAARLQQRWQKERTILIILDDVWKDIVLRDIGIPFGDDHKGCKILLTTRSRGICSSMGCQRKVPLSLLSEGEAWGLFKTKSGLGDEDSALNKVAQKVARECQGLPIALVTVGRALKDKSVVEWEAAFRQLKNSQLHIEESAYACLKLSYDYLNCEETKLCFLLCCLFPEDHDIRIENLTRYAVGYGLYQDAESIEDTRIQVYEAIESLKGSCMLLGGSSKEYVKMHDLVRDVAIQISKKYGFMVKAGIGLKEWPRSNQNFEGCKMISLMGNTLTELPEGLVCPQLKVLILELGNDVNVPYRFFEGMKEIEVLYLKGGRLLLESLEFLANLQFLELVGLIVSNKDLRKLQRLKILVLRGRGIHALPVDIGELKELRLLDLTGCGDLERMPMNLIGRLKKLEELLTGDVGGYELTELNSLSQLTVLRLRIPKVTFIPRDFVFPKLHKYDIRLGKDKLIVIGFKIKGPFTIEAPEYPTSKRLVFTNIWATSLNMKTFELLFPTVSEFHLKGVGGLKNIIMSSSDQIFEHEQQQGFLQELEFVRVERCGDICTLFPSKLWRALKNLRSVEIKDCKELEEVFELDEESNEEEKVLLLSSLTTLELRSLSELKCIWKRPTRHVSLQSLTVVKLWSLHKLKFIFTPSLAQSLQQLQTLDIQSCKELEEVFELDEESNEEEKVLLLSSLTTLELQYLSELKCIWKGPTRHVSLQSLTVVKLWSLSKLKFIFTPSLAQSLQQLQTLDIHSCKELEHIIREKGNEEEIITESFCFPKLKTLWIQKCGKLEYVFPVSVATSLLNLEQVRIQSANELKQIFGGEGDGDALRRDGDRDRDGGILFSFPQLRKLELIGSGPNLSFFGPNNFAAKLPSLEHLRIEDHNELGNLLAKLLGLTKLESVAISRCYELTSLWNRPIWKNVIALEFTRCYNQRYIFPTSIISSLLQLKSLKISSCDQLEEIIDTA